MIRAHGPWPRSESASKASGVSVAVRQCFPLRGERRAVRRKKRGLCSMVCSVASAVYGAIARNINIHLCVYGYTRKHKHEQNVLYMSPVSFQSTSRIAAHAEKMGLRLRAVP